MANKRKTKARRLQPVSLTPRTMSERIVRKRQEFPSVGIDRIREMVIDDYNEAVDTYNNRNEARATGKIEGEKIAKRIAKKGSKKSVKKILTEGPERSQITIDGKAYQIKKGLENKFWDHFNRAGNWKDYVISSKDSVEVAAIKKAKAKNKASRRPTYDTWDSPDVTRGPEMEAKRDVMTIQKYNDLMRDEKGRRIKSMQISQTKLNKLKTKDQIHQTAGMVLGSKTKKLYQKKSIPGPVGYLPLIAALFNEVRMNQEKKQKKRNG